MSQVGEITGGEYFNLSLLFGKTLVRWQSSPAEGSGFLFPSVLEGGEKGDVALTATQMTTNLQTHLRAAGMGRQAVYDALLSSGRGGES